MCIHETNMTSIANINLKEYWIGKDQTAQKKPRWLLKIIYQLYYCIMRTHKDEGLFSTFARIEDMLRQDPNLLVNDTFRSSLKRFWGNVKELNHKHRLKEKQDWVAQMLQKIQAVEASIQNVPAKSTLTPQPVLNKTITTTPPQNTSSQPNSANTQKSVNIQLGQPAPIQQDPTHTPEPTDHQQSPDSSLGQFTPAPAIPLNQDLTHTPAPTGHQQSADSLGKFTPAPTIPKQNTIINQDPSLTQPNPQQQEPVNSVTPNQDELKTEDSSKTPSQSQVLKTIHELITLGDYNEIVARSQTNKIDVYETDPTTGLNMIQAAILANPQSGAIIKFLEKLAPQEEEEAKYFEDLSNIFTQSKDEVDVYLDMISTISIQQKFNQVKSNKELQELIQKIKTDISTLCPPSQFPTIALDTTLMQQSGFWHSLADPDQTPNEQQKLSQWLKCPEAKQGLIQLNGDRKTPLHIAIETKNKAFFEVLLDLNTDNNLVDWKSPALEKFFLFSLGDPEDSFPDDKDLEMLITVIRQIAWQNLEFINDKNENNQTAQDIYNDKVPPEYRINDVQSLIWERALESRLAEFKYDFYKKNSKSLLEFIETQAKAKEAELNKQ